MILGGYRSIRDGGSNHLFQFVSTDKHVDQFLIGHIPLIKIHDHAEWHLENVTGFQQNGN